MYHTLLVTLPSSFFHLPFNLPAPLTCLPEVFVISHPSSLLSATNLPMSSPHLLKIWLPGHCFSFQKNSCILLSCFNLQENAPFNALTCQSLHIPWCLLSSPSAVLLAKSCFHSLLSSPPALVPPTLTFSTQQNLYSIVLPCQVTLNFLLHGRFWSIDSWISSPPL